MYSAVSPCDGDWFGGVSAANAGAFLDALADADVGGSGGVGEERLRPFWRGRMGLSKQEQLQVCAPPHKEVVAYKMYPSVMHLLVALSGSCGCQSCYSRQHGGGCASLQAYKDGFLYVEEGDDGGEDGDLEDSEADARDTPDIDEHDVPAADKHELESDFTTSESEDDSSSDSELSSSDDDDHDGDNPSPLSPAPTQQ